MARRRRRKVAYRKRQQNRFSMFLVTLVVLLIMVAISFRTSGIKDKIADKDREMEQIKAEMAAEEQRSEDIEEYRKYTETKGYIEEVAKDRLGLVYEGEIVFKEDE